MDKYKNGKIYTIRCKNDDTLIYVGSTTQPLFKRWHQHKKIVNNEKHKSYNVLLYQKMRETNIEDWNIELYEEFSCENKEQLNKQEGEVIRKISTLNKRIEGRTKSEYREDNKDKIKEYNKEYNKNHKDKRKVYIEGNKDKINEYKKEYNKNHKDKRKAYREANKDKIKEYNKEYQEKNKEKIKDKKKETKQTQQIT
jgi:hypothetical protein